VWGGRYLLHPDDRPAQVADVRSMPDVFTSYR
jgi:hypothetical protein